MAVLAPTAANAAIFPSLGGNTTNQLTLSATGLSDGTNQIATLSGGRTYMADQPFADIPKGGITGGTFLAAGPTAGQPATLTFSRPTSYLSFLWGSPDTYNQLTVNTNVASYIYTAATLNFARTNGDQSFSQYVQFATTAGELISSVNFTNVPAADAFETANFSVTAVPEPATWGMMLVGFGMIAATSRRRRTATKRVTA
ncbi:hypothetical protein GGQ80_000117 [Sphingomonas jinjuensis]|uniref:Ice-binding protein C-terminal domain-containing protein n=1 Tax=Sphingomonas jinjuensis TaxID=535907 RepID=A0A840F6Y3_9SPHN|nr:hypothetical protein [Sphingomonas jinjuensis]